ncbi:pilin [Patescibacteria group bacterium]
MLKKYLFIIIIVIALAFLFGNNVLASSFGTGLNEAATAVPDISQDRELTDYLVFATQAFLTLIGVIFVGILVYGGFLYMTAAGADEKIQKSKKAIASASIGILLILGGHVITIFIASQLEQPGVGTQQTYDDACENAYDVNFYSIRCCEYRIQTGTVVNPERECCEQSPYYNAHPECEGILNVGN